MTRNDDQYRFARVWQNYQRFIHHFVGQAKLVGHANRGVNRIGKFMDGVIDLVLVQNAHGVEFLGHRQSLPVIEAHYNIIVTIQKL